MLPVRLSVLLLIVLPPALCPPAQAQDAASGGQEALPADDSMASDEIVVTAGRYYGEASVAAETEFDEAEIASHGADSIQNLLDRLTPYIDPNGEEPVLLINGRPADGDRSILSYPAEALNRLAVLKPEAAGQYGYPSGRRVVNLVLKQHFASLNMDAGVSAATAGGQYGGDLAAGRVAIDGPTRWNVQARIDRDGALLRSARNLPPRPGAFDGVGYVSGPGGAEIDPALSLAAGEVVTVAAIPPNALTQAQALADFAATANDRHGIDSDAFETLQPSRRTVSFGAGVTRPLGAFSASLSINASNTTSDGLRGLRGLPMISAVLPATSPWSPFAGDVVLTRPFAGQRPLRADNDSKSLGMTLALSGRIAGWQTALSANYARNWSESLLERGVDIGAVRALIAGDPAFNPYGPWSERLLLASRNRARGDTLNARFTAGKAVVNLPAGPLTANVSVDVNSAGSRSWASDGPADPIAPRDQARRQVNGQLSFGVPLSRRGEGAIGPLGDLSLELFASGQARSGAALQTRFGGGMTWSPMSSLQVRGSLEYAEAAPSFDQLDGAVLTGINRVFDYARQEVVDAVWITGGNPGLDRGSRQSRSLAVMVRPLGSQILTLNTAYSEQIAKGGVAPFPDLTPAIEAAFPERVTRDAAGRLVSIDARAINLARASSADLASGIALRLPGRGAASRGVRPRKPGDDPVQFNLSLNHRWRLRSEVLTRRGVPVIDQLGDDGGQSRHSLSLQMSAGKRGIGAGLNGNWSSAAHLRNRASADRAGDLRFKPPATLNVSFFVEPEHVLRGAGKSGWMNNLKLSLDVRNLFRGYRRITRGDGGIPAGSSRDEIDPLGRTIRLTVRKRF